MTGASIFAQQSIKINAMYFAKKFKYNLKCALPAVMLAGASLMFPSCSKDEPAPITIPIVPTKDVSLEWTVIGNGIYVSGIRQTNKIKTIADSASTRAIYLDLLDNNDFSSLTVEDNTAVREFLQQRLNVSPKVHGRGNLNNVQPGTMLREDSLWFVNNGWTINQKEQAQP